jgi:hypothetical protein
LGVEVKSCNWVRRKGRDREKKREHLLTKSTDQNCMLSSQYIIKKIFVDVAIERG